MKIGLLVYIWLFASAFLCFHLVINIDFILNNDTAQKGNSSKHLKSVMIIHIDMITEKKKISCGGEQKGYTIWLDQAPNQELFRAGEVS